MPELPEVETIRRGLLKCIVREKGGKILEVRVEEAKSFIGEGAEIVGATVVRLRRKGKALILDFDNRKSAIIHLRMTGQLVWVGKERFAGGHPNDNFIAELPNKQTRVEIVFENGTLFFNDQRKFGFIKVVPTSEVEKDSFIAKLAKEPWEMTGKELFKKLQRHKGAPIKSVILDQTIICGLGNIYADEALFYASIHPRRKAGSLSAQETEKLVEGARVVMERSLDAGGSTIRNYVKSDGTKGDYLELFAEVFNRQGKPCRRCGERIEKIKVGGRGTHFCPKCQKE
ncbi:bifunctional DNA-formamidopyrimidine glycosylase/DNA-(apurinic or apyrimidinic site) lyase [Candidatus Saccharibacteria bacterium]|nr:bifunctional DNA-formamidopyrimidine glycosylase/DNA-(apurinic or apyrimidinic site) lyase [Candidatus Saccharibacteria bacterium]